MPTSDSPRQQHRHGVVAAFGYAFAGLATAWQHQPNVRIHAGIGVAVLVVGSLLRLPAWAWVALILAMALVITTELINTAVEALVDLASPGEHPLAREAKDVAAAAVLAASIASAAVGAIVVFWALTRSGTAPGGVL